MVPTRNLLHHDGKNSKSCYCSQYCVDITAQLEESARQDHHKSSRSLLWLTMANDEPLAVAASKSSAHVGVDAAGDGGNWLQLGLAAATSSSASSSGDNNGTDPPPTPVELDLFTCGYNKQHARMRPPPFPLPLRSYQYGHGRYLSAAASGSMSAPPLPFMPPFKSSGDAMRVISPPRRTEATGLWLTLQAAPNQYVSIYTTECICTNIVMVDHILCCSLMHLIIMLYQYP
jgi:hypothetical protein